MGVVNQTTVPPDHVRAVHMAIRTGPNSHNTLQLGQKAERRGKPWWRVTTAEELRDEWFAGLRVVGLTAGTSTTDETVAEVHRYLRALRVSLSA